MPPNALQIWDFSAAKRHLDDHHDEAELDAKFFPSSKEHSPEPQEEQDGQSLWRKLLNHNIKTAHTSYDSELIASMSSIIVLDDEEREKDWLNQFGGRLTSVSTELLEGLR